MITRIWADLIDTWLAVQRAWLVLAPLRSRAKPLRRPAQDLWRTLPGDLQGRAIMLLCGGLSPSREVARPNGPPALLVEDPRAGRYLDHVPLKPYAQTLGRYVIARETLPDTIVRHELEHVDQWTRLGPLFLPAYGAASFVAILAGRHRYFDNLFEIVARSRETETWSPDAREVEAG
jgi:hypothetical protein